MAYKLTLNTEHRNEQKPWFFNTGTLDTVLRPVYSEKISCAQTKFKNVKIAFKVKCHRLSTTSSIHRGTYSYQITSIFDQ